MTEQELANVIWDIKEVIRNSYDDSEVEDVILPFTLLRRLDCVLEDKYDDILEELNSFDEKVRKYKLQSLMKKNGITFFNMSGLSLKKMLNAPDHVGDSFKTYLEGFTDNVKDILANFVHEDGYSDVVDLSKIYSRLDRGNKLFAVILQFVEKADLHPNKVRVPSHWDVAPVKRYANIFTGNTPSTKEEKYYDSEDINWFTPVDFYKDCLRESTRRISEISRKENACRIFPSKSVYMIGIGGTIGKIATCEEEASANQQINVIMPNANADYRYLAYCMRCQKEEIMLSANVVTLPIINQEKTGFLFMPHPRKTVQITIADYLNKKCASIDASISKAQHQVDLLQEYKQSLITEVVIGKRKVC